MSDFKAKLHQIRFRLGLCPRPAGGAYSAPPDPGPTSKGRKGKGRGDRGGKGRREEKGKGWKGRGKVLAYTP